MSPLGQHLQTLSIGAVWSYLPCLLPFIQLFLKRMTELIKSLDAVVWQLKPRRLLLQEDVLLWSRQWRRALVNSARGDGQLVRLMAVLHCHTGAAVGAVAALCYLTAAPHIRGCIPLNGRCRHTGPGEVGCASKFSTCLAMTVGHGDWYFRTHIFDLAASTATCDGRLGLARLC
jgi:hypothetical protein